MSRVKRGTIHTKRRKNILKLAKGYRFGRSTKLKQAREAVLHAGNHAFRHRKDKKRDYRRLWQLKINAALRPLELSYSKFINMLLKKEVSLDRKSLAYLAEHRPEAFKKVV
ncbi:MAG: large subunit ribosomal protein L20, partial [Flavobacteriaceae bacterium]